MTSDDATSSEPLRLHVGGKEPRAGWKILNIQPGPGVDYVGSCLDLSRFGENTVDELYASHVYEHLSYAIELSPALKEAHRVLKPGGRLMISVPDLERLCWLFLQRQLNVDQRIHVMRMMFGGQVDAFDYHKVGLSAELLIGLLKGLQFTSAARVENFGLFQDTSTLIFAGVPISLNVIAVK